jgi:hypothetical protein
LGVSSARTSHLTLVVEPAAPVAPPGAFRAARRPGERCEAVPLKVTPAIAELGRPAVRGGLSFDLAYTLCLERHIARSRLEAEGPADRTMAMLDDLAARSRAEGGVSASLAAYVRHLLHPSGVDGVEVSDGATISVAVPMRLVNEAAVSLPPAALTRQELDAARGWEVAAALNAMQMGEWAGWTAWTQAVRTS